MRCHRKIFDILFVVITLFFSFDLEASRLPSISNARYALLEAERNISSLVSTADFLSFDALYDHLNFGFTSKHLLITFDLVNPSDKPQQIMLVLDNPLLEKADLYCEGLLSQHEGLLQREHSARLSSAFRLEFAPYQKLACLLHLYNGSTTLQAGISVETEERFERVEQRKEYLLVFFLGMLFSLAILSFMMYLYAHDKSYLFYILYLTTLVFQQMTYTGFLPSLAPLWFNKADSMLVVPKVAVMIIAASLYARAFLRTKLFTKIDRIYKFFIFAALLQIPFVSTHFLYLPEVTVFTGLLFVLFNTYAGIVIYLGGYRSARFFVLAWLLLAPAYIGMILDAFGIVSFMYRFPMLIIAMTTIEAILLLLAGIDRFYHFHLEKLAYERRYNRLLNAQKEEVENRVALRTAELKDALDEKEILFRELHHRIKNNLQLILSIVRLQRNRAENEETKEALGRFEQRVATIANTHEMLRLDKGVEKVEMQPYMHTICTDLIDAVGKERFACLCDSDVELPLREAVYLGLILNELLTNLLKHKESVERVHMELRQQEREFFLRLHAAMGREKKNRNEGGGLGLLIVKTLVQKQLRGSIEFKDGKSTIVIRFRL